MKNVKQQKQRVLKPSTKQNANRSQAGIRKPTNSNRGRHTKARETFSAPACMSRQQGCTRAMKVNSSVAIDQLPSNKIERVVVQIPISTRKIKLQLFPLDERIRTGLEKDGHNPHLELTLSVKKKISSVLLHLNNKWGTSSVALGDPALFPYNIIQEDLAYNRSWTLNDEEISAGDVYAAIGYPTIFRLRYGWFPDQPNYMASTPPTSTSICEKFAIPGENCDTVLDTSNILVIHSKLVDMELDPGKVDEQPNVNGMEHAAEGNPCKMVVLMEENLNDEQPNVTAIDQTAAGNPCNTEVLMANNLVDELHVTGMEHAAEGNPFNMVGLLADNLVDEQQNVMGMEHAAEGNPSNMMVPMENNLVDEQPNVPKMEHVAEGNPCNMIVLMENVDEQANITEMDHAAEGIAYNMVVPIEDNKVDEKPNASGLESAAEANPCNMKENKVDNGVSYISAMLFDSQSNSSMAALLSESSLLGKFNLLDSQCNISMGALLSETSLLGKSGLPDSQNNVSIGALLSEASLLGKSSLPDSQNNVSIGALLSEASLLGKSSLPDYQNHISVGALLSEASLIGKSSLPDGKSSNSRYGFQSNHLVSDSFDAMINKFQSTQQAKAVTLCPSILDAENTCHSFAFEKNSSLAKDFPGSYKSFSSLLSSQDDGLKSRPQIEGKDDKKPSTDELLGIRPVFNEEDSLGFSGINWNDSLGPWDLGVPSQQLMKSDSISMSGFVW